MKKVRNAKRAKANLIVKLLAVLRELHNSGAQTARSIAYRLRLKNTDQAAGLIKRLNIQGYVRKGEQVFYELRFSAIYHITTTGIIYLHTADSTVSRYKYNFSGYDDKVFLRGLMEKKSYKKFKDFSGMKDGKPTYNDKHFTY